MEEKKMDLVYANLPETALNELKEIGASIEDASDDIHTERVSVYYPEDKKEEYYGILHRHGLLGNSMGFLVNQ